MVGKTDLESILYESGFGADTEMEGLSLESPISILGTRTYVVGFVQAVVGKQNIVFQWEDGKKMEMSDCSMSCVYEKEEVGKEREKIYLTSSKADKVNH